MKYNELTALFILRTCIAQHWQSQLFAFTCGHTSVLSFRDHPLWGWRSSSVTTATSSLFETQNIFQLSPCLFCNVRFVFLTKYKIEELNSPLHCCYDCLVCLHPPKKVSVLFSILAASLLKETMEYAKSHF